MAFDYLTPSYKVNKDPEVEMTKQALTVKPATQNTNQNTPTYSGVNNNQILTRDSADNQMNYPTYNQNNQYSQNTQVNNQNTMQPVNYQSSVSIKVPTDLNDITVQSYLSDYNKGVEINDYQAQINALTAIDNYRVQNGLEPIYNRNILELNNLRNRKINMQISDYERQIQNSADIGDYASVQAIGNELEQYKNMVGYQAPTNLVDNKATYLENLQPYRSDYMNVVDGIVQQLLMAKFAYDPSSDEALQKAQAYATNTAMERMNARGILNSTMTAQIVTATVANLETEYMKMAKEDFYENIERLQSMANFVMSIDNNQYKRWIENVQLRLDQYDAKRQAISDEWERVDKMGYVDNVASVILGVPAGSLSPSVRASILKAQQEAEKETIKLQTDLQMHQALKEIDNYYDIEEYQAKKAIDYGYDVSKSNLSVNEYAQKQAIKSAYGDNNTQKSNTPKTQEETQEEVSDEQVRAYFDSLVQNNPDMGKIDDKNIDLVNENIITMLDNGQVDETTARKMVKEAEQIKDYNTLSEKYLNAIKERITTVKNSDKKVVKKLNYDKKSETIESKEDDYIKLLGYDRYNQLLSEVKEMETELSNEFKNKGVNW